MSAGSDAAIARPIENGDLSAVRRYARLFGECADEYENARPGYPEGLIKRILTAASGAEPPWSAIEVGAGSGKATVPIAATGLPVNCIEPSRRMAKVLREKCAAFPNVSVSVTSFERWRPHGTYTLLVAAQSWHLVDPVMRIVKSALVLRRRGVIALMWNQPPQPVNEDDRNRLTAVLAEAGIDMTGLRSSAMIHGREAQGRVYTSPYFDPAQPSWYSTQCILSIRRYAALLATYPEYRMMKISEQRRLMADLTRTVFGAGPLPAAYQTVLHMASRTAVPCKESTVLR